MPSYTKAFTLVELLVVIAIFTLMTGFIAVKYGDFSKNIVVQNLAYDIALTIREAQTYGINVSDIGKSGDFSIAYGVRFDTVTPRDFILFADLNGNRRYDPAVSPREDIKKYTMNSDMRVYRLCHDAACTRSSSGATGTYVDVMFRRPSPVPVISSGAYSQGTADYVEIRIANKDNSVRKKVVVRSSGQISISDV